MKKIIPTTLFLFGFCIQTSGQISPPKIGDLIKNTDGSKGIVFWIDPEETHGYMLNLIQHGQTMWGPNPVDIPGIASGTNLLADTNGYGNTLAIRNYYDCSIYPDIAACKVDVENGWFLPSYAIANYLYMNYLAIRPKLVEHGGDTTFEGLDGTGWQTWTSSQYDGKTEATIFDFMNGEVRYIYQNYSDRYVYSVKRFSIIPEFSYDTTLNYQWNTKDTLTEIRVKPANDSTFSVTATSQEGCVDMASQQVFVASPGSATELFDTICAGYAYANNGFTLPADSNRIVGTTTHQKTLSNGDCDVSVTLHLTKHKTNSTAIVDSFCTGKSYVCNGTIYDEAGDYVQFLTSENGCDSVLNLKLSQKKNTYTHMPNFANACGQYVWNNQYYYTSGIYSQTFVAANGCDSVVDMEITISKRSFNDLALDSCKQVTYKNTVFFNDTTFVDTLVNSASCDSLLTVKLSVTKRTFGYLGLDTCKQVTYKNTVFYKDTTFTDTLVNSADCDSLLTVNVTILKSDFDTVRPTAACDSVSYRGKYYFSDTICTDTLLGGTCGTVLTAYLSVPKHSLGYLELNACDQITYNANTFLNDTTFVETLANSVGCDSLLTVNLTVNPSYFDSLNLSEMDSIVFEEKTYFRDTILTFLNQTFAGCDSILEVHISVKESPDPPPPPPPPHDSIEAEIVVYWHKVLAVPNRKNLDELKFATYYWYKDDVLLPQSNKDWIEVGSPIPVGKYNVSIVYDDKQIAYLERIFDKPFGVSVYPNPVQTTEELTIDVGANGIRPIKIKRIEIFDLNGVLQKLPIRVNGALFVDFQTSGIYILKIHLDNQVVETIKIVVK